MRFLKTVISLVIIAVLCYAGYKFVDYKQTQNSNTIEQQKGSASLNNSDAGSTEDNSNIDSDRSNEGVKDEEQVEDNVTDSEADLAFATSVQNIAMLVNPNSSLPENYVPDDLVYPDVRFTFNEKIEKRMLREEAARALEKMFAAAEVDGIYLAGVSGYRSHETQTKLFNYYVERDGYDKAKTYSAVPGTSEHETGLAIDISGSTGKCAAQDCFGGTAEAIWLANNGAKYGFIVRYPEGKENITGYKYEPWHMRYVGVDIAEKINNENITLEEYYGMN